MDESVERILQGRAIDIIERDPPRTYPLTENMRRTVGVAKSVDKQRDVQERAIARVQSLPSRIQDLIDDIHLLHYGDPNGGMHLVGSNSDNYITRDIFESDIPEDRQINNLTAEEFSDIDWEPDIVGQSALHKGVTFTHKEKNIFGVQMGYGIAVAVQRLEPLYNEPFNPIEYLWGNLLAFTEAEDWTSDVSPEERKEKIDEIISGLEVLRDARYESVTSPNSRRNAHKYTEEIKGKVENKLSEAGLSTIDININYVTKISIRESFISNANKAENFQDLLPNSGDIEDVISQVIEDIETVESVTVDLHNDQMLLLQKEVAGQQLHEIIQDLWFTFAPRSETDQTSRERVGNKKVSDISKYTWKPSKWSETTAARWISDGDTVSEDSRTDTDNTTHPILVERIDKSDERPKPQYKFTHYGALVAYTISELHGDIRWLYEGLLCSEFGTKFETELVQAVNDEIDLGITEIPEWEE